MWSDVKHTIDDLLRRSHDQYVTFIASFEKLELARGQPNKLLS